MLTSGGLSSARSILAEYAEKHKLSCRSCGLSYRIGHTRCPTCGSRQCRTASGPEVEAEHPEILGIPKGKSFLQMPVKHFVGLAKTEGAGPVRKAVSNLILWTGPGSKNPNPKIVSKAKKIRQAIKEQTEKRP